MYSIMFYLLDNLLLEESRGSVIAMILWKLNLHLHMLSVLITTKVMSSTPAQGEMCSIQPYVIKFISDLLQYCQLEVFARKVISNVNV
jgi:hypothetical protein